MNHLINSSSENNITMINYRSPMMPETVWAALIQACVPRAPSERTTSISLIRSSITDDCCDN
uniref:Candidate secreted effector n=1 Tax=Meloidogyne incognita TaxID=6306 RepID=A0A914MN56_MELIC